MQAKQHVHSVNYFIIDVLHARCVVVHYVANDSTRSVAKHIAKKTISIVDFNSRPNVVPYAIISLSIWYVKDCTVIGILV